jgi:hypothetical protein
MRLLNAIEAGTTTGAQLETLLTDDPGRLAELSVLLGMRGQNERLFASATATEALIASPKALNALVTSVRGSKNMAANPDAMNAVAASSTAMTAVAASSTAMTAVAASSTAMTAVAASSTAKLAIRNSDTALSAIGASVTAMDTLFNHASAATATVATAGATTALAFTTNVPNSAKLYLAIGTMTTDPTTGATHTIATRRAGSTIAATLTPDASNLSSAGFKRFAAPVPIADPMTIQTSDPSTQTLSVRLINCSDNTVYA